MLHWLLSLIEILLLVFALSTDAFAASLAYGMENIHIPRFSAVIISAICSSMVTVSMVFGRVIGPFIPPGLPKWIGFCMLLSIGIVKLFDSSIKAYIRRHQWLAKNIHFSFCSLRFILTVYAAPEEADQDTSKNLSSREAASLAIALSLDGLAAGFGAGLASIRWGWVFLLSFLVGLASIWSGHTLGQKLANKTTRDLSWLGGTMLILLALMKLR